MVFARKLTARELPWTIATVRRVLPGVARLMGSFTVTARPGLTTTEVAASVAPADETVTSALRGVGARSTTVAET